MGCSHVSHGGNKTTIEGFLALKPFFGTGIKRGIKSELELQFHLVSQKVE